MRYRTIPISLLLCSILLSTVLPAEAQHGPLLYDDFGKGLDSRIWEAYIVPGTSITFPMYPQLSYTPPTTQFADIDSRNDSLAATGILSRQAFCGRLTVSSYVGLEVGQGHIASVGLVTAGRKFYPRSLQANDSYAQITFDMNTGNATLDLVANGREKREFLCQFSNRTYYTTKLSLLNRTSISASVFYGSRTVGALNVTTLGTDFTNLDLQVYSYALSSRYQIFWLSLEGGQVSVPQVTILSASPATPSFYENVTVRALIKSYTRVSRALIVYSNDGGTSWKTIEMKRAENSVFEASIPPEFGTTTVDYYVIAFDDFGYAGGSEHLMYHISYAPLVAPVTIFSGMLLLVVLVSQRRRRH